MDYLENVPFEKTSGNFLNRATMMRSYIRNVSSIFALLSIIFIPFPFHLFQIQIALTDFLFGGLIKVSAQNLLQINLQDTRVYSDFVSMYLLVFLLFIIALLTAFLLSFNKDWRKKNHNFFEIVRYVAIAYLTVHLLKYGVDKIFKNQFYQPEPNILFTPFGKLNKGMLYWSTMGTSHFYSVFLGVAEVLAALLLFFNRTRLSGLLLSLFLFLNIVAINFAFDISVKLFSLFLLFLTLFLLAPYIKSLWRFLFGKSTNEVSDSLLKGKWHNGNYFIYGTVKSLIGALILLEAFYPFANSHTLNSDNLKKPLLYGAYKVIESPGINDSLQTASEINMFFIHKDGYLIFQDKNNIMKDYRLEYDTSGNYLLLIDYQMKRTLVPYYYSSGDSILKLNFKIEGVGLNIEGKAIDISKLPALEKGFHWTVD